MLNIKKIPIFYSIIIFFFFSNIAKASNHLTCSYNGGKDFIAFPEVTGEYKILTAGSKIDIVSIVRNFISKEHYNPSSYGITDLFSFHRDKNYYNEINAHIEN